MPLTNQIAKDSTISAAAVPITPITTNIKIRGRVFTTSPAVPIGGQRDVEAFPQPGFPP